MAVSAYSAEGLLKKNPLLGTSLGVDPTRVAQAQKFGELHERAKGFTQDRAGFQKVIGGEYEALQKQGLADLATQQADLGTTRTALKGHQAREFDINEMITYAQETGGLISRAGPRGQAFQIPKRARGFEAGNPLIAREAQTYWDELGRREGGGDIQSSYRQGFRPEALMSEYETAYGESEGRLEALGLSDIDQYGYQTPLRQRRSALSAEFGSQADPWSRTNPWLFDPGDGSIWDEDQYAWVDPESGEVTANAPTAGSDWMNRAGWGNMSTDLDGDGIPDIVFDASGQMMPLGRFTGKGEDRRYVQEFEDLPENRIGPEGQTFVPGTGQWESPELQARDPQSLAGYVEQASGAPGMADRQWITESGLADPLGYDPMQARTMRPEDFINPEEYTKRFFDPRQVGRKTGGHGRRGGAAAARMAAYMDKMGLQRASSEIDLLEQTPRTEAAIRRIEELDKGIVGSRQSLADRAEFYGGFFS